MVITRLALLACLLVACDAPLRQSRPSSPTASGPPGRVAAPDAGRFDGWEAVERDIVAAESTPEVCGTLILGGERRLICCPRGQSYDMATQACVVPAAPIPVPAVIPPTFSAKLKELEACAQGPWKESGAKSHGRCEDGKRFFETNGMHTGRTDFYRDEQSVGFSTWSDVGSDHYEGDTGCKVIEREGLCGTPLSLFSRTVFPASLPAE